MRKIISICFFVVFAFFGQGQNENSKWYFGGYAALDFMTNPPTILNNSAMNTNEGCSSIADSGGNLLFYTNGVNVWNKQHITMANGAGLLGDISSSQSVLIIKQSNNSNLYHVFTLAASGSSVGLNYSIVDMSLSAGMGSVTVKNAPIYNAPCTEQIHATRHANGVDFWIITHQWYSNGSYSNNFRAYLLTATGVNTTAVISSVGTIFYSPFGCMKFSPNGQKLGVTLQGNGMLVEMYDFDNNTGVVSNPITLSPYNFAGYGCEFSPEGTKFYAAPSGGAVTQWDLSATSNTAIISSSVAVSSNGYFGSMQLAPNGKIYAAISYTSTYLSVINNPNSAGLACNFVYTAQPITTAISPTLNPLQPRSGLPNMITTPNMTITPPPCISVTVNNLQSICVGSSYVFNNHTYNTAGIYNDTLQTISGCDSIILTQLTVNECLNVDELKLKNQNVKIYPNPTNEILNVDISTSLNVTGMINEKQIEIYIYDVLGNTIIHNSTFKIYNSINVASLPKGIYFVKVGKHMQKFVKE